jgi:hypothetical protein
MPSSHTTIILTLLSRALNRALKMLFIFLNADDAADDAGPPGFGRVITPVPQRRMSVSKPKEEPEEVEVYTREVYTPDTNTSY